MRTKVILFINGEKVQVSGDSVFWPLSRYIREYRGLTGTKVVCAEGDCGACTILVSDNAGKDLFSINSCISPVFANDGRHIITIEGLSLMQEGTHAVTSAMIKGNGAQCGFCSPGFVMSLTDLYEHNRNVDEQMVKKFTTGNLCRCTGYRDIIKSALSVNISQYRSVKEFFLTETNRVELEALAKDSLLVEIDSDIVAVPGTLEEFFTLRIKYPDAKILSAATDLGVLINKGKLAERQFIFIGRVQELNRFDTDGEEIYIGANRTLTEIEDEMSIYHPQFSKFLEEFASPQIKNRATLVGNIANGSPIGDSLPFLCAVEATLIIASKSGVREVPITKFYKGYKDFDLMDNEIIIGVKIPKLQKDSFLKLYKVANRTHLDISTVSAAFYLVKSNTNKIESLKIAYGGVGPTVLRLSDIESKYTGEIFDLDCCEKIGKDISTFIKPISDVRGSDQYRKVVAGKLALKFYYDLRGE